LTYIKLNLDDLDETCEKIKSVISRPSLNYTTIKQKVELCQATPTKTRKLYAVDSGFNTAYETPFVVFKAAIVDENLEVTQKRIICLFHADTHQTNRFKTLILQETMYRALSNVIKCGKADNSLILVDGTITLNILYPTLRDSKLYNEQFKNFVERLYSPLLDECFQRNVLILGFLKRTGSTHLSKKIGLKNVYDVDIMDSLLRESGQYIKPILLTNSNVLRLGIQDSYITFYLNLKGWNYRFELIKRQKDQFKECIGNLLFWATHAHFGMNPIFSKADENSRVTKREANIVFNYIVHSLPEGEKNRMRRIARKKTHFGYRQIRNLQRQEMEEK